MNAFDPEFGDLAVREKELQKVLAGFTEGKASTRDPFLRQVYTEDAAFVEWSFRMQNVVDFKNALVKEEQRFAKAFTGHLLRFALSRELVPGDSLAVDEIVRKTAPDNFRLRSIIREVVLSKQFSGSQN